MRRAERIKIVYFIYSVKKKIQVEMLQNDITAVKNEFKILEDSAASKLVTKLMIRKNCIYFLLLCAYLSVLTRLKSF